MAIHVIVYAMPAIFVRSLARVAFTLEGPRLSIGRARGCDLRLPDRSVSPLHASLVREGGGYALIDGGSAHGTHLSALDSSECKRLGTGDRLPIVGPTCASVGPFRLLLCPGAGCPADGPGELATATLRLLALTVGATGKAVCPSVFVRRGPSRGRRFYVDDGLPFGHSYNAGCVLGRDVSAEAWLRGAKVSRRHCELKRSDNALWVRDLGSTNGTWLAGDRLPAHVRVRWPRGDSLYVGDNVLDQEDPVADALDELDRTDGEAFTSARPPTFPAGDEERVRRCALDDVAAMADRDLAASRPAASTEEPVLRPVG